MKTLKKAFELLDEFTSLSSEVQHRKIGEIESMLCSSEKNKATALLALREIDQLQKQRSHMLISSGQIDAGIDSIQKMVADHVETIANLHEDAAFQLAEAAIASFRANRPLMGQELAQAALMHSGKAERLSRTVLTAFELLQRLHEDQCPGELPRKLVKKKRKPKLASKEK